MGRRCLITSFSLEMLLEYRKIDNKVSIRLINSENYKKSKNLLENKKDFKNLQNKYKKVKGDTLFKEKLILTTANYPE